MLHTITRAPPDAAGIWLHNVATGRIPLGVRHDKSTKKRKPRLRVPEFSSLSVGAGKFDGCHHRGCLLMRDRYENRGFRVRPARRKEAEGDAGSRGVG